jgi:hypothetical protein
MTSLACGHEAGTPSSFPVAGAAVDGAADGPPLSTIVVTALDTGDAVVADDAGPAEDFGEQALADRATSTLPAPVTSTGIRTASPRSGPACQPGGKS